MSTEKSQNKSSTGHLFKPGHSGNPGGRGKINQRVRQAARLLTEDALIALQDGLQATKLVGQTMQEHPDHATRIYAAQAILDRGWGKPSSEEVVAAQDANELDEAASMSTSDLLAEAIKRAKALES